MYRPAILCLISLCLALAAGPLWARPAATPAPFETLTQDLSSKAGTRWEFRPEGGEWKAIAVPAGGWRAQGDTCDAGTYRTTIRIPESARGRRVRVAFAAVNFGAEVFAGKDEEHLEKIASHVNGWMPFTADLSRLAVPGESLLLVVEVKGRNKFRVNGKFTVPEGASWFSGLADGILRGIALEMVPPVHLSDVFVRTSLAPDTLHPEVTVTNDSDQPASVSLEASLSSWNKARFRYPAIARAAVTVAPGGTGLVDLGRIPWKLGPQSYWWPNVPYQPGYRAQLHLLDVALKVNGRTVHHVRQRFGFRRFRVDGNHYELNGIRCNLRGDNQQEADFNTDAYGRRPGFGPPSPGNPGWPQAVANLLRLNFNVMRIHQIPATPYMLDVCDELGLMIVDETPLRGSEGREDWNAGREAMTNMCRELALRDRNHPAVVIWSAANEWTQPMADVLPVMRAVDDTRPIIADGVGEMGPNFINMQHYCNGLGGAPLNGGSPRNDRPYGETEAVWPMDNTWQGFAWMATTARVRRLKGNADVRNYVFNNAWPNYVPGEGPETEILEKKVKNMGGDMAIHAALTDPWNHPNIRLMQQCYHPLTACDVAFDRDNARSNDKGEWPVLKPRLSAGAKVSRRIAVFNDEFRGENVTLRWQARSGSKTGAVVAKGEKALRIPLGEFATEEISFDAPKEPGDLALLLTVLKDGKERFSEDRMLFSVVEGSTALKDGEYRLVCRHSELVASVAADAAKADAPVVQGKPGAAEAETWQLKNLGGGEVTLTHKKSGLVLGVRGAAADDAAPVVLQPADGKPYQIWRLEPVEGDWYTLTNKGSGKVLDAYKQATNPGSELVQYAGNGGENQQWQLR